jgi:F-type H+-transporting ATPase subunit delta
VTSGAAAGRYARALFDVVLKEVPADAEPVLTQLQDLASLFTGNATLSSVLSNPAIPIAKKMAVTKALLERAGTIAPPLAKTLLMLAERDRLAILPDIARIYRDRLTDHQKVIRGEVTTAVAIAPARLQALRQGLEEATGRKVVLEAKVDPSIIGGVVTRLGSTVYDGSVTTQLAKMKQSLIEAGQ